MILFFQKSIFLKTFRLKFWILHPKITIGIPIHIPSASMRFCQDFHQNIYFLMLRRGSSGVAVPASPGNYAAIRSLHAGNVCEEFRSVCESIWTVFDRKNTKSSKSQSFPRWESRTTVSTIVDLVLLAVVQSPEDPPSHSRGSICFCYFSSN